MGSRKTDITYQQRGTDPYQSANSDLVRGSLLASLLDSGLLPDGTLSQSAPPADTSLFWVDEATDPETLKYHNGTGWVSATFDYVYRGGFTNSQSFSSSGSFTWVVPDGVTVAEFIVYGAGGGGSGGRAISGLNGITVAGGGGGGAGGYGLILTSVTAGDSISITVGSGGAGAPYNASGVSQGDTGTVSSVGAILSVNGGGGGTSQSGGLGGHSFGGDVNISGEHGHYAQFTPWTTQVWHGGAGGRGIRNGAGSTLAGFDGPMAGSGGSGAARSNTTAASGGDGADGLIVVRW